MTNSYCADTLMATLPPVLVRDPKLFALARAFAEKAEELFAATEGAILYAAIDRLDEHTLDAIAEDFGVGWYRADADINKKRAVIAEQFTVHRIMGTKAALQAAIAGFEGEAEITEWFENPDGPLPGSVLITLSGQHANMTAQQTDEVIRIVNSVKRASTMIEYMVDLGIEDLEF